MPFTVSHAAATLLVRRRKEIIQSAFVVGAIAPDLGYFVRVAPQDKVGHTFPGVFLVTLPVGLAVLWVYHRFTNRGLKRVLPARIGAALQISEFSFGGVGRFAAIVFSMLLGIMSHVLWDEFTHADSSVAAHLPLLHKRLFEYVLGPVAVADALQGVSSVGGGLLVGLWLYWAYRKRAGERSVSPAPSGSWTPTWVLVLTAAAVTALRVALSLGSGHWTPSMRYQFAVYLCVGTMGMVGVGVSLLGIFDSWNRNRS